MYLRFILAVALMTSLGCTHFSNSKRVPSSIAEHFEAIDDEVIQSLPEIGDRKILKFSLLKDSNGKFTKLYLQNPKYQFHHEFLTTLPEFKGMNQKEIEALTYKNTSERKAYIGVFSIEYRWFVDMDRLSETGFYVMSEDLPAMDVLSAISEKINALGEIEAGDANNFIPLPHQEIEAVTKSSIFTQAGLRLTIERQTAKRAYSDGWNVGILKLVQNQKDLEIAIQQNTITKDTILVIGEALRELPPCAGVISAVRLTAGSHLSLLAQMYAIPLVYEEEALKKYAGHEGKTVLLASNLENNEGFQFFDRLAADEIQTLKKAKNAAILNFDFDPTIKDIVLVNSLQPSSVKSYGGKSTQFGLLQRTIPQNSLATAAGVPLFYYSEFFRSAQFEGSDLRSYVQKQLTALPADATYAQVTLVCENIRNAFKQAVMPAEFFEQIRLSLIRVLNIDEKSLSGGVARLKIRSSSNVEDGSEFNGAGLYDSEGVCVLNCQKNDFEKGLRKVWGSLYSDRGLWARRTFHVDENKVAMGLLAHAPFKNEIFNGVIRISQKKNEDGLQVQFSEVTAQKGEEKSVTNAVGESSAEVVSVSDDEISIQTTFKGLPKGRTLMNQDHYKQLHRLMQSLIKNWPMRGNLLEIESEWKVMNVDGKEKIFIKQVRQVPRQNKINLADGSEKIWITGGFFHLKGFGDGIFDPLLGLYRVRDLKMKIKSFTEKQLKSGQLIVSGAEVVYKDQKISMTAGKVSSVLKEGIWTLTIPLTHKDFPGFKLTFSLAKTRDDILTETANGFMSVYESKISALGAYNQNKVNYESLIPASTYLEHFNQLEKDQPSIEVTSVKNCPISIKAVRELYLGNYDRARMYLTKMEVAGILSNKSIYIPKVSDSFHQKYIHDGYNVMAVDLFADPSLADKEKEQIDKLGRYLLVNLGTEVDGDIKRFSGNFKFVKNNFKNGIAPKGCPVGNNHVGLE